jgi:hypothetical protein
MAFAIWNAFFIPVDIAFSPPEFEAIWLIVLNGLIDLIFCIDIIFNFRTTYYDKNGQEQVGGK